MTTVATETSGFEQNYRPNNGTDGDCFNAQCCDRCMKDHAWHADWPDAPDSCPIIMDALSGEHAYPNELGPPQWSHNYETGESRCSEFEGPCDCELLPQQYPEEEK